MNGANVNSIDAIRAFRAALIKFAETADVAMNDAESEISRTMSALEGEWPTYWAGQIRKRQEIVSRAKDAVRAKKLFKDSTGRFQSAIDEEKALQVALKRLAEAEQKAANVKRHRGRLVKEIDLYRGSVQRFATAIQHDIPLGAAKLDRMMQSLEAYMALTAPGEAIAGSAGESAGAATGESQENMARGRGGFEGLLGAIGDFPQLEGTQVALLHRRGEEQAGETRSYVVFESIEAAREYAVKKVAAEEGIECAIYDRSAVLVDLVKPAPESLQGETDDPCHPERSEGSGLVGSPD